MKNLQTSTTRQPEQAFRLKTYKKNELATLQFEKVEQKYKKEEEEEEPLP